jgi:long-chain acyl-CoA synthetase
MEQLIDFFDRYIRGSSQALVYDDGFRRWSYTYDQLRATALSIAGQLTDAGLGPGDRLLIWSDSRPEWVATFWGCMLCGVAVVPVDASTSPDLVERIAKTAQPRGAFVGDGLELKAPASTMFVSRLSHIHWLDPTPAPAFRPGAAMSSGSVRARVEPHAIAEIVFTSGTTGEPKGVVITHRNIVANITPVEREVAAYRRFLWPFRPIRFLNLLPLSHMFGQALSIFLPALVNAATVFTTSYNPDQIVSQVRRHRITLMVTVPRVLEMLRARIVQRAPRCAMPAPTEDALPLRLWRYRDAHRVFGWRFCGFVLGGASLDRALEDFWGRLGYAVIQGYGLTETAPIVAWNHPFKPKHGTVGRPLEGIEVRIAADGEILVRGPTVTSGYLNAPEETRAALEGGWFHTGDLGAFDDSGHLVIRGRKKDVIATLEGLKVFPEDVERVLEATSGVREAAVVGRVEDHAEYVHAVLVLHPNADPAAIIREVNATLEPHQRIRDFSVWTTGPLPRTEAMRKLKRFEIRRWVEEGRPARTGEERAPADEIQRLLSKYGKDRVVTSGTTLDELGLTSLDRVELMMALEDSARVTLSETAVSEAHTVGDLRRLAREAADTSGMPEEALSFPGWARWPLVRLLRIVSQRTWILPLANIFFSLEVEGREHLRALAGPIVFASNHQSHFDTPVILKALPTRWRRTIAVAMWKEYFDAHFFPERHTPHERLTTSALYYLVTCFFNAFPLPQSEPGTRQTLRHMGDLATDGSSILIFPEGFRTERGEISPFQPGIGLIASKLRLPVVPVRLEGVDRVLHHTWHWPRRGPVRVTFGAPLLLEGDDYAALARRVREAVAALQPLPVEASRRAPGAAA